MHHNEAFSQTNPDFHEAPLKEISGDPKGDFPHHLRNDGFLWVKGGWFLFDLPIYLNVDLFYGVHVGEYYMDPMGLFLRF